MLHTKFQAPEASGLKEILKYFFMYFYDWNLGPSGTSLLGPWDPHLNKFGIGSLCNAICLNFKHLSHVVLKMKLFEYFLWFEPRTPRPGPI